METKIYVELLSFSYLPISSAFVHCFSLFNRKGKMVRQPENINACLSSSKTCSSELADIKRHIKLISSHFL